MDLPPSIPPVPPQAELYRMKLRREQLLASDSSYGSPEEIEAMDARIAALEAAGVPDGTHLA